MLVLTLLNSLQVYIIIKKKLCIGKIYPIFKLNKDGWAEKYPEQFSDLKSPLVEKLVSENKLGRKTGEGFYKYNTDPKPKV
jgi:hypothetical protein